MPVVLTAAGILSMRMLGLFMVLPVFILFASGETAGASPWLMGLALGGYGLTQALLQVPLGRLSDRIGRRRVIAGGLLVFVLGSVIAATADGLVQLLIGRLLQGAGAISSAVLALVGDVTSPRRRSLSMALVGMAMGGAFLLSLVVGPALGSLGLDLGGFFWAAALLGMVSLLLVSVLPEAERRAPLVVAAHAPKLLDLVVDGRWRGWNVSVFVIHLLMSGCFVSLPLLLVADAGLPVENHGWLYFTTLVVSCVVALPLMALIERRWSDTSTWPLAGLLLVSGLCVLVFLERSYGLIWLGLMLFFAGFNLMEAGLPAGVSRRTQAANRGMVMGVFASHQFLGAFAGGMLGGLLLELGGPALVLVGMLGVAIVWVTFVMLGLSGQSRGQPDEYIFESGGSVQSQLIEQKEKILGLPGVLGVRSEGDSGAIFVEFDRAHFRAGAVWDLLEQAESESSVPGPANPPPHMT